MPEKNTLINILTYKLPAAVAQPICREYDWRRLEIQKVLNHGYERYAVLRGFERTIDALLALSLFYRHVLANFEGASEFYVNINKGQQVELPVRIGNFTLNQKERNRLQAIHIRYSEIMAKYQIGPRFFEYAETIDFLRNCIDLYNTPEQNGENDSI